MLRTNGRRSIRVMDLRSTSNLDNRLANVLLHHNAIRKGLKKDIKKNDLKKNYWCTRYFKVCSTSLVKARRI